jgi:hypothetical protein
MNAQTFKLKEDTYVSAVGLYFRTKHAIYPITVEIRDAVNGQPGTHLYAWMQLPASSVNLSSHGTVETVFTFANVIQYKKDIEYCFTVLPYLNNTGYEMFCAEKSEIDFATGQRIVQPHEGIMFHSPNGRTWEEMSTRDMTFKLYQSNFVDNAAIVFTEVTGLQASRFIAAVNEVLTDGTVVKWFYSLDSGVSWEAFNPDIDVDLEAITTKIILKIDVTSAGGSYRIVGNTGIQVRLHSAEANAIFNTEEFTDDLNYPDFVTCFCELDTDGVNGAGVTSVTPYYSVDDGETWTIIPVKEGYTPVATTDPFYRYEWELADPITPFSSFKGRLLAETSNVAKTPRIGGQGVAFICSRIGD